MTTCLCAVFISFLFTLKGSQRELVIRYVREEQREELLVVKTNNKGEPLGHNNTRLKYLFFKKFFIFSI